MTDRLFIKSQQLVVGLLADNCVTKTRDIQTRNHVVQYVLRRETSCAAEFGCRRNTVLKNTPSQCRQLHTALLNTIWQSEDCSPRNSRHSPPPVDKAPKWSQVDKPSTRRRLHSCAATAAKAVYSSTYCIFFNCINVLLAKFLSVH